MLLPLMCHTVPSLRSFLVILEIALNALELDVTTAKSPTLYSLIHADLVTLTSLGVLFQAYALLTTTNLMDSVSSVQ